MLGRRSRRAGGRPQHSDALLARHYPFPLPTSKHSPSESLPKFIGEITIDYPFYIPWTCVCRARAPRRLPTRAQRRVCQPVRRRTVVPPRAAIRRDTREGPRGVPPLGCTVRRVEREAVAARRRARRRAEGRERDFGFWRDAWSFRAQPCACVRGIRTADEQIFIPLAGVYEPACQGAVSNSAEGAVGMTRRKCEREVLRGNLGPSATGTSGGLETHKLITDSHCRRAACRMGRRRCTLANGNRTMCLHLLFYS